MRSLLTTHQISSPCIYLPRGFSVPVPHTQRCNPARSAVVLCVTAKPQACCSVQPASDPLSTVSTTGSTPAGTCYACTALAVAAAGALVAFVLKTRQKKSAFAEEPDVDLQVSTPDDPRHHARVLAKARQATHINSAITYNKAGEQVKAVLELNKALAENSVCRATAVITHSNDDLADLYRLHIRYTEQPPNFATLLQLQEMLGLSQEDADQIETQLLRSPGTFAI